MGTPGPLGSSSRRQTLDNRHVEIMTSTTPGAPARPRTRRTHPCAPRLALALAALCLALAAAGCGTGHPRAARRGHARRSRDVPLLPRLLGGPTFAGHPLAAADGQASYDSGVGDSVYYGDCVQGKGIFGGGSCLLPLQVTTVIYGLHSNSTLGPQRNTVIRGVPAVVYDEGRSIELYSGRLAIDIFSDTFAHAHSAALRAAPAQRARLGRGEPARAGLLPRALRAGGRAGEPRDGEPAGERLPARGRRRSAEATPTRHELRSSSAQDPAAPRGFGLSGLPISRRRPRNASEPINAGIHSEIAR